MLSPSGWGDVWTGRHQLATRFARKYPLVWMCPSESWQTAWRVQPWWHRTRHAEGASAVEVYEPPAWLPRVRRSPVLDARLFARRLRYAAGLLSARGVTDIILYIWRPAYAAALDLLPHTISCYHINDEYSFAATASVNPRELDLIRAVDQVIIHSPELMRRKGGINPRTAFVPNGVDYQAFATPVAEPPDLSRIPHPRVGYVGWLKRHLDWPLLQTLCDDIPQAQFVLVGPTSPHADIVPVIAALAERPNVHVLGGRPVHALPAYVQHMDVGIMPYVVNDYTRCIYPLKAHEYLAAGRPVVSTRLPSTELLQDVVLLAESPAEWTAALRRALDASSRTSDDVQQRQDVAADHDWDVLATRILDLADDALGARHG